MSKKPTLANAKFKAFPHIVEKTGEKVKVKDSSEKIKRVDEIRFVKLNEEYIKKILLSRGIAEENILNREAEKKELQEELKTIEEKYKITHSTDFIKNKKNEIHKEYEEKLRNKIDISELLYIINKGYSEKTATINVFKNHAKYIKRVQNALLTILEGETDKEKREKIKVNIAKLEPLTKVIDGTKKENIKKMLCSAQNQLEREADKKEIKKISGTIAKIKRWNCQMASETSTAMINKLSLNLFEYLKSKLQKKYKKVVIYRIIADLLKTVVEVEKINEHTVKDNFIKNARAKKS